MKTPLLRIVLTVVVFLAWTPAAYAWSWPVQGPVLQPFSYDSANPYAAGQHRGVDIGAGATGDSVVAPAAGTVSFAGTVPTSGRSVTIQTSDGYSVTLTHLGSTLVAKGQAVAEQDAVGTVGPSGTAEVEGPYVHLGIRVTSDPDGYLDPLGFLPAVASDGGSDGSTSSQPGSGSSSSTATGGAPASAATTASEPATPNARSGHASTARTTRSRSSSRERGRAQDGHSNVRQHRSTTRAAVQRADEMMHAASRATPRPHANPVATSSRRPVVETVVPSEPIRLDAGHEIRSGARAPRRAHASRRPGTAPLPILLNGVAALVALGAALRTANGRRRRSAPSPVASAHVLHLPRRPRKNLPVSRAA